MIRVTELVVYPVKSCRGVVVPTWELGPFGLQHDRSYMVVDQTGRYLTQRERPALALVTPELLPGALRVTVANVGTVEIPTTGAPGNRIQATVWEHTGPALDCGSEVAQLLTRLLDTPCRLVRLAPEHERPVDPAWAPAGTRTGFADGFPLLITSEESLADLNGRLPRVLPMARFRPNIVVAGAAPFAEDDWRSIRVGEVPIDIVKPCARCAITTVDPETGRRDGAEPLRTLGTFRRGERGVLFGQNAVHRGRGRISVGDPVLITGTGGSGGAGVTA